MVVGCRPVWTKSSVHQFLTMPAERRRGAGTVRLAESLIGFAVPDGGKRHLVEVAEQGGMIRLAHRPDLLVGLRDKGQVGEDTWRHCSRDTDKGGPFNVFTAVFQSIIRPNRRAVKRMEACLLQVSAERQLSMNGKSCPLAVGDKMVEVLPVSMTI